METEKAIDSMSLIIVRVDGTALLYAHLLFVSRKPLVLRVQKSAIMLNYLSQRFGS